MLGCVVFLICPVVGLADLTRAEVHELVASETLADDLGDFLFQVVARAATAELQSATTTRQVAPVAATMSVFCDKPRVDGGALGLTLGASNLVAVGAVRPVAA